MAVTHRLQNGGGLQCGGDQHSTGGRCSSAFPCVLSDLNVKVVAGLGVPFKNFVNRFVCLLLLFYGAKYYT